MEAKAMTDEEAAAVIRKYVQLGLVRDNGDGTYNLTEAGQDHVLANMLESLVSGKKGRL